MSSKNLSMEVQSQVSSLVEWCIDRSETLNEADSIAILQEFEEWIEYEADETETLEVRSFHTEQ
jgi:hypothetical protein